MLWLSRKDIEHISRRLLRDYLKKVPQKVDHIDPTDFAEKMCGLQFTFADISEAHDAIGLTGNIGGDHNDPPKGWHKAQLRIRRKNGLH